MDQEEEYGLQVIIASGLEAPHRAIAGFALALAAAASGTKVVVWLTMHGATWAVRNQGNQEDVPGFSSVAGYIRLLKEEGASIEFCTTCSGNGCLLQGGEDEGCNLREGIKIAGLAPVASRLTTVPTVTF